MRCPLAHLHDQPVTTARVCAFVYPRALLGCPRSFLILLVSVLHAQAFLWMATTLTLLEDIGTRFWPPYVCLCGWLVSTIFTAFYFQVHCRVSHPRRQGVCVCV